MGFQGIPSCSHRLPCGFLLFSYGAPMGFIGSPHVVMWFSCLFPCGFLGAPIGPHTLPCGFLWFPDGAQMAFRRIPIGCLVVYRVSFLEVCCSVSQSVRGVGLGPTSGGGVGLRPTLGGPHERGRLRARTPNPHTPKPQLLARIRPRSWGGARWGATSAWCALGNLRDFGAA